MMSTSHPARQDSAHLWVGPGGARWLYIEQGTIGGVKGRSSIPVIGLVLAVMLVASSAAAAQPVSGFASYRVTLSSPTGERSTLLNESYTPSDRVGYSDFVLQLTGTQQNFTYSRLVNASEDLLPFLPSVAPQSLEYSNGTRDSLHVNLTSSGTAKVIFGGSQYVLNVLAVSVAASYGNRSARANGTVETFPSALVYSASVSGGSDRLNVTLQATDLPLTSPGSQMPAATYVGAGVGVGVAALGGIFLIRRKERKRDQPKEKPLHWVD